MKVKIGFLKLDVPIQGLLLILNAALFVGGIFGTPTLVYAMLLQAFIGFYQVLVSGTVNLLSSSFAPVIVKMRQIHFILSIMYVLALFWMTQMSPVAMIVMFIVIPQILAHAYFGINWLDYRSKKRYLESRPTIFAY